MQLLLRIRYLSYNTLKCMAGVALFYSFLLLLLYCLFCQTSFFRGIPFRSVPNLGMGYSETHGIPRKEHLFRGTTKTVPSLFRGIFWDGISMATLDWAYGENDVRVHWVIMEMISEQSESTRKYQNLEFFSSCCRFLAPCTVRSIRLMQQTDQKYLMLVCR